MRAVDFSFDIPDVHIGIAEMAAHLLYWSTLYAIKTQATQRKAFSQWLGDSMVGRRYDGETGMMVKYVFLDFDGVLNTEQYCAELAIAGKELSNGFGPPFSPKSVSRLGEIIERTNAQIVVSSSWCNIYNLDEMRQMWALRRLPGEIFRTLPNADSEMSLGEKICTAYDSQSKH